MIRSGPRAASREVEDLELVCLPRVESWVASFSASCSCWRNVRPGWSLTVVEKPRRESALPGSLNQLVLLSYREEDLEVKPGSTNVTLW